MPEENIDEESWELETLFQSVVDGVELIVQEADSFSVSDTLVEWKEQVDPHGYRILVMDVFGVYSPKTEKTTTYFNGEVVDISETYVDGIAGVDFDYFTGVFSFFFFFWAVVQCFRSLLRAVF